MSLAPGQTLTHYELLEPLGAGGMGEVWLARDTKLDRDVAIKVLPEELAGDADRLHRFEREAKTLASLNHPHVAGIHGVDQVGDTCFLALELVPGEDLATRVAKGALPLDEALDVCRQIAEGLEAAHEAGVVHRDLKPANVRITREGVVKLLDFGLAKPMPPVLGEGGTTTAASDSFLMTEDGVVLGTPTYMSPEQARGRAVDRRTDIWAFGCVLYECLTGQRVFAGGSFPDILAAIISEEPDWSKLPPLPPRADELLRRALVKEPRGRLRDIGDARVQLELAIAEGPATMAAAAGAAATTQRARGPRAFVTLLLVVAAFAAGMFLRPEVDDLAGGEATGSPGGVSPAPRRDVAVVLHTFPPGSKARSFAISPDGRHVAWSEDGLWVRSLADLEPRALRTDDVGSYVWSPDGREVAFLDEGELWRQPVDGGRARRVADVAKDESPQMLAWLPDGRLVFGGRGTTWTVPADGGTPEVLIEIDVEGEFAHWHFLLPLAGDRGLLGALHRMSTPFNSVAVFRDGDERVVFTDPGGDFNAVTLASNGHLVYGSRTEGVDGVWSVPFSLERLEATGSPRLEVENAADPSVSADGTLAYVSAGSATRELAWLDRRDGELTAIGQAHEGVNNVRLSPGGRQIAFQTGTWTRAEVWVHDLDRGVATPRIKPEGVNAFLVWLSEDRLALGSPAGIKGTTVHPVSGRGESELLSEHMLVDLSADGDVFVYMSMGPGFEDPEFLLIPEAGTGEAIRYLRSGERYVNFSPDGRWLLYSSKQTGTEQLHLTRFPPSPDEDWIVAVGHQTNAMSTTAWVSDDGSEILYVETDAPDKRPRIKRVSFSTEPEVRLGAPELLLELDVEVRVQDYDGAGRFLVTRPSTTESKHIYIDTGWGTRK